MKKTPKSSCKELASSLPTQGGPLLPALLLPAALLPAALLPPALLPPPPLLQESESQLSMCLLLQETQG